jgi:hypothetical protein
MACKMELVRELDEGGIRIKRCVTHGIAVVEDGSSAITAHPNIHGSGSVAGMRDRGWWDGTDVTVRCHGWIYNVSQIVGASEMDKLAQEECRCGGCLLVRAGRGQAWEEARANG